MIIVHNGRSTARLDGRWHPRVHLPSAGVAMERGERRILHDGRWLPLRSLAWLVLLFFVTAAAFGLPLQAGVDLLPPERADLQFGATLIASACALVLYAFAVRLGEGRQPSELALRPALKGLAVGVALGLLLMVILMSVMALSGLYAITWVGLVPVWGGLSLAVQAAVTEELWMRAMLFRLLWRAFGPPPGLRALRPRLWRTAPRKPGRNDCRRRNSDPRGPDVLRPLHAHRAALGSDRTPPGLELRPRLTVRSRCLRR